MSDMTDDEDRQVDAAYRGASDYRWCAIRGRWRDFIDCGERCTRSCKALWAGKRRVLVAMLNERAHIAGKASP